MNRRGNDICELEDGGPLLDDYCEGDIPSDEMLIYQMVFGMAWIMLAMVIILYSMISVYLFVRKQERQAARWSANAQEGRQQKRVLTKGIAIIGAYILTWVPSILSLTPMVDAMTNPGIMNTVGMLSVEGFYACCAAIRTHPSHPHCSRVCPPATRIFQCSHFFGIC